MNGEIKFKSLNDLYERLRPAFRSKIKELKNKNLNYIHEEDIWNYLKEYKWVSSRDLDLGMMVNDIFSIDIKELDQYVRDEIKNYRRDRNLDETIGRNYLRDYDGEKEN